METKKANQVVCGFGLCAPKFLFSHSETQNSTEKEELGFLFCHCETQNTQRKKSTISYSVIEKPRITQRKKKKKRHQGKI